MTSDPRTIPWTDPKSPRIWRSPDSNFYGDEPLNASNVYTDAVLARIAAEGFNGIWLRGRLYELMRSTIFPELQSPDAARRLESLQTVIERGRRAGVGVYLYFNEPLAVKQESSFWLDHPELKGVEQPKTIHEEASFSLCTSMPLVREFLREATRNLLDDLTGLGGVILITASEFQTHCYSHHVLTFFEPIKTRADLQCPRCAAREPSEIVLELLNVWRDAAARSPGRPRVLAWNWSWSMWYPDPQTEIVGQLPEGVELLVDFERGTTAHLADRDLLVDEYSLAIVGPGKRFMASQEIARRAQTPVHAKVQIGTTHEIATVPNLPLMHNLHAKMAALSAYRVRGIMATWNFGCSLTLNTFAVGLFIKDPAGFASPERFLPQLAREYFGAHDSDLIVDGWRAFCDAFKHFPFTMSFVYHSPINYAPAYELTPRYDARPMGPTWLTHTFGDRLEDSLSNGFTIDDVIAQLTSLSEVWERGLGGYVEALRPSPNATEISNRRRKEESSCAKMIHLQMRSAANVYRFHHWRSEMIRQQRLTPPCTVSLTEEARTILADELLLAKESRQLCAVDARLGFHQECHAYMYNVETIDRKIESLRRWLK